MPVFSWDCIDRNLWFQHFKNVLNIIAPRYNDKAYQIYKFKVLPKCKFCDRTFNYESLKIHERGCDKKPKGWATLEDYLENK